MRISGPVMLVGAAAGLAGLLWLFELYPFRGDEGGIRVKNGSAWLETVSSKGFKRAAHGVFKTKNKTKGCYDVVVNDGVCQGEAKNLSNVELISFIYGNANQGQGQDEEDEAFLGSAIRLRVQVDGNWTASGNEVRNAEVDIQSFTARAVSGTELTCSPRIEADKRYFDSLLTPRACAR